MTDEQIKNARALRGSGLAKKELMRIIKGADQEEQRFMLRFFKTADIQDELDRRSDHLIAAIEKILDAADNAKTSITDLRDAELFIDAITATLRGMVK